MHCIIQDYLRAVTTRARDVEQIGPFLATFSRSNTNPFLNYAIPGNNARPSRHDIERLIEAYTRRGLNPRLEYITSCAPEVEGPLLAADFHIEGRLALMTCSQGEQQRMPVPVDIELLRPQTERELLGARQVQHEAYGEPEPAGPADVRALAANLEAGGMAVLARVHSTGEPAGAGEYTEPLNGITEITSIAVRPAFRRRGIAAAMTAWLLQIAFDAGISTPFLMANEAEERIYARVGFRRISEVLHISYQNAGILR